MWRDVPERGWTVGRQCMERGEVCLDPLAVFVVCVIVLHEFDDSSPFAIPFPLPSQPHGLGLKHSMM